MPNNMPTLPRSLSDWSPPPWDTLQRLRQGFLSGQTSQDYWQSEDDVAAYDVSFAERIGWKWDAVLRELQQRGMFMQAPKSLSLIDWGCGSGIASRRCLEAFPSTNFASLMLLDRSAIARQYAQKRAQEIYPLLSIQQLSPSATMQPKEQQPKPESFVLLLSHVLTELNDVALENLLAWAQQAYAVIWVEPGMPAVSQRLIMIRERLRAHFGIIAPCPHQDTCGLISSQRLGSDWCHNFAEPPAEIFQNATWQQFSRELSIDLRSLPVSFLAMEKFTSQSDTTIARVLGRPRGFKPYVETLSCEHPQATTRQLLRRQNKSLAKALEKKSGFTEIHAKDELGSIVK